MKLLKPVWVWKSRSEYLRKIYEKISLNAVKKITSEKELVEIASVASSLLVREVAIQAVTTPTILFEVSKNPHFLDTVRLCAAKKIKNQIDIYLILVSFHRTGYLHKEILRLLTDENLLAKIVCDPREKFQHSLALRQITNLSLLENIAKNSSNSSICCYAVEKLTNQSVLSEIAETSFSKDVRRSAVEKITDQAFLAHIVQTNSYYEARFMAMAKIREESQDLLVNIAQTNSLENIRITAVKKLSNPTVLAGIAQNDTSTKVRYAAIEKLTDATLLSRIAQEDAEEEIRALAVGKLTNQTLLSHILQADSSAKVRGVAARRIKDKEYFKLRCKENVHDWTSMEGCKKICTLCGVQAYNHSYVQVESRFSGLSDEEIYTTEYRCSKCGHKGETQTGAGVWVDNYDTREEGLLSK